MATVVVLSHNVHPYPRSAEAIVTGALVDGLRRRGHDVAVLTSPWGHTPLDGSSPLGPDRCWAVAEAGGLRAWRHRPARSARGVAARLADRAATRAGRDPFPVSAWADAAAPTLLERLAELDDPVVWARGLPESSLAAARRARAQRPFPLVCSLGDPLPPVRGPRRGTDAAVARAARRQVAALGPLADVWTFPSRRVAEGVVAAGGLDPARAVVLAHLVPGRAEATADGPEATGGPEVGPRARPVVAYVGSAYRWLLDGPLLPALARAQGRTIEVELALRDADEQTIDRVRAAVPAATVHRDLEPLAAAAVADRADALLVPGPRADLLYTKVVEALGRARPVLTLTPVPGTTAELVAEAGGVVVAGPEADPHELDEGLAALARLAADPAPTARARRAVADRLAADAVLDRADAVLAFAAEHHRAVRGGERPPPPPSLDAWP